MTFHDPCNVVRGRGLHEKAREVVRAFCPNFIEMTPNKEHNYCCAAGGEVCINCGSRHTRTLAWRATGSRLSSYRIPASKSVSLHVITVMVVLKILSTSINLASSSSSAGKLSMIAWKNQMLSRGEQ